MGAGPPGTDTHTPGTRQLGDQRLLGGRLGRGPSPLAARLPPSLTSLILASFCWRTRASLVCSCCFLLTSPILKRASFILQPGEEAHEAWPGQAAAPPPQAPSLVQAPAHSSSMCCPWDGSSPWGARGERALCLPRPTLLQGPGSQKGRPGDPQTPHHSIPSRRRFSPCTQTSSHRQSGTLQGGWSTAGQLAAPGTLSSSQPHPCGALGPPVQALPARAAT